MEQPHLKANGNRHTSISTYHFCYSFHPVHSFLHWITCATAACFCFVTGIVPEEAMGWGTWGQSCATSTPSCPGCAEGCSQAEPMLEWRGDLHWCLLYFLSCSKSEGMWQKIAHRIVCKGKQHCEWISWEERCIFFSVIIVRLGLGVGMHWFVSSFYLWLVMCH